MLFNSVVIAMVFAIRGVKHGFHCTGKERELSVNLENSVYIIHSCDPPQFCPWTDKLLLKVGRAKEMVKI